VIPLDLPQGASVAAALDAARVRERFPEMDWSGVTYGLWSRPCAVDRLLRDGDRVEIYRPLAADPKDQRRSRARLKPSTGSRSEP
jgi:putative ubiquitin-RnfH superfamily antitoxin RatB of RatAB toxin-antitoxin module